jgi:hypothetical protein
MAPPPLIRRSIDVVVGNPEQLADQIEAVFASQNVAVVCRVTGSIVKVEISTLDLAEKDLEEHLEGWIEKAAADVAVTIQWMARDAE